MIVQVAPTPLHESIAPILVDSIKAATNDLPASIRTGLRTRTSKEYVGFTDNPLGSEKIPDLAITYKVPNGNREIVLVLEVGFTQNWDDLVKIARRWIEKTAEFNMVLIAKLTENPKYSNPIRNTTNEQLELLELKSASDIRDGDFELEGESRPVTLKGFSWVGTLSECYIEAWARDKRGAAAKLGERVDLLDLENPGISFNLTDFLPISSAHDRTVLLSAADFREVLGSEMRKLALNRYQRVMARRERRR